MEASEKVSVASRKAPRQKLLAVLSINEHYYYYTNIRIIILNKSKKYRALRAQEIRNNLISNSPPRLLKACITMRDRPKHILLGNSYIIPLPTCTGVIFWKPNLSMISKAELDKLGLNSLHVVAILKVTQHVV